MGPIRSALMIRGEEMKNLSKALIFIGFLLGLLAFWAFVSPMVFNVYLGLNCNTMCLFLTLGMLTTGVGLAMGLCFMVRDRMIERAVEQKAVGNDESQKDIPLCYTCLTPAEPLQHFCTNCWTPLTSHAEIDPIGHIYAIGDMYWKLTRGPQKRISLIGGMLLLAPVSVMAMLMTIAFIAVVVWEGWRAGFYSLMYIEFLMLTVGGIVILLPVGLYFMIFVKMILNYRRQKLSEESDNPHSGEPAVESTPDD
jgi:hypothetical protein